MFDGINGKPDMLSGGENVCTEDFERIELDSPQTIILKHKDRDVLIIDKKINTWTVVDEQFLPYPLKGRIQPVQLSDIERGDKYISIVRDILAHNDTAFRSFLADRVLPLSRENAKKIYNILGFEQKQDDFTKAGIALSFRAVTLQDCYWVSLAESNITWEQVDLKRVQLRDDMFEVALHGAVPSVQGSGFRTPEASTQGAYAKAWRRENGEMYLYKKGYRGETPSESEVEVMVSELLDLCNIKHLKYEAAIEHDKVWDKDVYCCKCKCMTDDKYSMLSGSDFNGYCNRRGVTPELEILKINKDFYYKMQIIDYLIANPDRHSLNWGFFVDNDTNKIIDFHLLYDHNNAFDKNTMRDKDYPYNFKNSKSMRECALYAMKRTDFYFRRRPVRSDFLTEKYYKSFIERFDELNIPIKK